MSTNGRRATRRGYWIGAGLALLGISAGIALIVWSFVGLQDGLSALRRVPAPGRADVELPAGKHVLYVEASQGAAPVAAPKVSVTDARSGRAIPLSDYATSFTYETSGRSGRAVETFVASHPGTYRVTAAAPAEPGTGVAVGPPMGGALTSGLLGTFGGVGLLVGGILIGGVVALVTALRRHVARRPAAGHRAAPQGPATAPQPGWYPDPSGQTGLRWWDGHRWTEHTG